MAIILEGPDGGGKTTLLKQLVKEFPQLQVMPRFASSEGGPITNGDDLFWLARERSQKVIASDPYAVYDRHPMISEYIYRDIVPDASGSVSGVSEVFLSEQARVFNELICKRALVIFCLPPYSQAVRNINNEPQMKGVASNYLHIYKAYRLRYVLHSGTSLAYNYQDPSHFNLVKILVHNHLRGIA